MPLIFISISLFLIFCALYGISPGVSASLRLLSRLRACRFGAVVRVLPATAPTAPDDALGRCTADLDRLFELQQCGALTRHEFEALKHHLMLRATSAT